VQPLVDRPEAKQSEPFSEMANAIKHNAGQAFGGAVVIVPPEGGGEPISLLMLDSKGDVAQFYGTISSRIQMIVQDLQEKQRVAGFGR